MNDFPVTAAESRLARANARIAELQQQIRDAEHEMYAAELEHRDATRDLERARAVEAADSIPVGTRVKSRAFDIYGTVVKHNGTGLAVLQDLATEPTYGFGHGEWIAVPDAIDADQRLRGALAAEDRLNDPRSN